RGGGGAFEPWRRARGGTPRCRRGRHAVTFLPPFVGWVWAVLVAATLMVLEPRDSHELSRRLRTPGPRWLVTCSCGWGGGGISGGGATSGGRLDQHRADTVH